MKQAGPRVKLLKEQAVLKVSLVFLKLCPTVICNFLEVFMGLAISTTIL